MISAWYDSELLALSCVDCNLVLRCSLKPLVQWSADVMFCFHKCQAPSQSNINYWVGSGKSVTEFQHRSQLFTHEDSNEWSFCNFEPVCIAFGLSTAPSSLPRVSNNNIKVSCLHSCAPWPIITITSAISVVSAWNTKQFNLLNTRKK